jgi:hypothetical protein
MLDSLSINIDYPKKQNLHHSLIAIQTDLGGLDGIYDWAHLTTIEEQLAAMQCQWAG